MGRRTQAARLGKVCLMAMAAFGLACVPLAGGWSIERLRENHPEVALPANHRLADNPPHFWPLGERAVLFLCRFENEAPITIRLPADASTTELADLRLALRVWEGAIEGLRFEEISGDERPEIEIRYDAPSVQGVPPIPGTGLTVTDCAVDAAALEAEAHAESPVARIPANLVRAQVILRRTNLNTIGREVTLDPDVRLGAALHELGHALGFSGHVGSEASIMTTTTDKISRVARAVRAGERLPAASVAALYAVPNGAVVGEAPLAERFLPELEAAYVTAERRGWQGPFVRVGDRAAQLHFRNEGRMAGRLSLAHYARTLRNAKELDFAETRFVRILRERMKLDRPPE